jgi:hypothetical protein
MNDADESFSPALQQTKALLETLPQSQNNSQFNLFE